MRLPNANRARIEIAKLTGYVLNLHHPEGRHKARVFRAALGIDARDAAWLADALVAAVGDADAVLQAETKWGTIWRAEMDIVRGRRCAKVRTVWLCRAEETRLVTCFVIGECDEAA
ncbi:MAG: hypothetical protein HXY29_03850 [Rhodocyclaceae bacterium]|jgi:hypothetical protein|nr:hypothetical protein [Rhodocyclaceae bacterium]